MITIYHNPRCRKSREALAYLQEKYPENEIQIIEYLKNPPTKDTLRDILKKLGIKPQELIRTNEKEYKELYKGKELSDEEWLDVLIKHPKLMQRPIVINGNRAVIARPAEKIEEII